MIRSYLDFVNGTCKRIRDRISTKRVSNNKIEVGIYKIGSTQCPIMYNGKILKSLKTLYDHRGDMLHNNTFNTLLVLNNTSDHNLNILNDQERKRFTSKKRKCMESVKFSKFSTIHLWPGPYIISLIIRKAIIAKYGIRESSEKKIYIYILSGLI